MIRLTQMAAHFASLSAWPLALFSLIFLTAITLCIGGCARGTSLNRVDILDPMDEVPRRCFITPQHEGRRQDPLGGDGAAPSHSSFEFQGPQE